MTPDEAAYELEEQAHQLRWHDSWCIDGLWCPHWDMLHAPDATDTPRDEAPTPDHAGSAW